MNQPPRIFAGGKIFRSPRPSVHFSTEGFFIEALESPEAENPRPKLCVCIAVL
jgi:hypothetical protein